jgi:succinyl-CoA synthetase beta subunit
MIMLSAKGGIDIEQVAHDDQNAVIKLNVNPLEGLSLDQARQTAEEAMLDAQAIEQTALFLCSLYRCYTEGDCDLVEVNPLVLTTDDKVHALDAKVTLDDSAAFRHEEWAEFDQDEDSDPREIAARQKGLNYVGLAGNVGIIANGAGLAMSTLDVVSQAGGEPANFLDIGGGANADTMAAALEVINSDPNVKVIFVNIFGGITRCDEVAKGIVEALSRVRLNSPIVLRLDGTNAQIGRDILEDHLSENFITVPTMLGAADKVVELTKEAM